MNNNQVNNQQNQSQNQTNINAPTNPSSTQNSLDIAELREGMVVMRDGSFRAVVNALTFPIQILVRSQRVDIEPYLNRLAEIQVAQDNMLLSDLMEDYINFIDSLSRSANIMDKSFFIVIPYYPSGDITNLKGSAKGFFGKIFAKPGAQVSKIDRNTWDKAREEIKKRVDSITGGLYQMGIKSVQLNTKELGELYYNVYNPDTAVYEPLGDFRDTASLFVRKAEGERPNQGGF